MMCSTCLGAHEDADCPSQYPIRTVNALERIVALLEKPVVPEELKKHVAKKQAAAETPKTDEVTP